jgi:orotidine-5'-phosphate decarboxylase
VQNDPRIIVALDFADQKSALKFVEKTSPDLCKLKVGKELFTRSGPQFVETLVAKEFDVFLDLKFHDIPNTVRQAVYAASQLGVWMVNVHALGGQSMLEAAREGVEMIGANRPYLVAVSLLTSMSASDLRQLGIEQEPQAFVERLAKLSIDSGVDGLVCSPREAKGLRQKLGDTPLLVTPGIRPAGSKVDDQQRISTPQQAIIDGASYLVIGRPITQHANPVEMLESINASISD